MGIRRTNNITSAGRLNFPIYKALNSPLNPARLSRKYGMIQERLRDFFLLLRLAKSRQSTNWRLKKTEEVTPRDFHHSGLSEATNFSYKLRKTMNTTNWIKAFKNVAIELVEMKLPMMSDLRTIKESRHLEFTEMTIHSMYGKFFCPSPNCKSK